MIVTRLLVRNWGPYRGEHVLKLKDTIYAVVARAEEDPGRSNWIGKTWLLAAIRFALYGTHPKKTEDGWITDGEQEGGVELDLEGGVEISRSRQRGKATQLELKRGGSKAKQARAQEIIEEIVGFDDENFARSSWIGQKEARQLIAIDPAPRTKIVVGWMDMGRLQDAAGIQGGKLNDLLRQEGEFKTRVEALDMAIQEAGDPQEVAGKIAHYERFITTKQAEMDERVAGGTAAIEALRERLEAGEKRAALNRAEAELDQVVKDGKNLKNVLAGIQDPELETKRAAEVEASGALREKQRECNQLAELVYGAGFDGTCPVTNAGCPVADDVKHQGAERKADHDDAQLKCGQLRDAQRQAGEVRRQAEEIVRTFEGEKGRLAEMRDRAKGLIDKIDLLKADAPEGNDVTLPELREMEQNETDWLASDRVGRTGEISSASSQLRALENQLKGVDGWVSERGEIERKREELARRVQTAREASVVLGRSGAQREIAEGALAEIEEGADELLQSTGEDLTVSAQWARPGGGLADTCTACGAPFPKSLKVKECEACGAKRGPKLIEKLEIALSRESGAAEDLAGLALQLSAATWLRARRGSDWSCVLLDEPLAACDSSLREKVPAYLCSMIRGRYSFRQGFVVSHDAATVDAMPARIEIVRARDGQLSVEVSG